MGLPCLQAKGPIRTHVPSRYDYVPLDNPPRSDVLSQHGSFGGPALNRDSYYSAGSEDFRGYVWQIPDLVSLEQRRKTIKLEDWAAESNETVGEPCDSAVITNSVPDFDKSVCGKAHWTTIRPS